MATPGRDEIIEILKEVNYPGFSRDIVSFGMVGDVVVKESDARIELKISTNDEEKKQQVAQQVRDALKSKTGLTEINVTVVEPAPQSQGAQAGPAGATQGGDPWATLHEMSGVTHTIAVASGKGGVGKSTVAANLAAALKAKGHSVGLPTRQRSESTDTS